jgi:tetratricopeptide (TPR) repeat protein
MMGQLSSSQAVPIAKQVCEGLSEAHRIGVVHRDLKPSNIMIDKDGNAKIMDFGIARSLTGKGITGVGVMIGTPEYMSPEQVESKEIDQKSDIYSLGVVLYEMVTGRVPFEGDTPYSIGVKHKSELPRNPKDINPQISDDINRMILKCLEKEKEKRYQSAGELRSELENIERGMPTTDRVIPERKPLTSKEITVTLGLKKLLVPALALLAVVIVAVVIWQPWSKKAPTPLPTDKPSLAVVYFENNTGDEGLDHWRKGISELLITDLTQSKYLKVLSGDKLFDILSELNQLDSKSYSAKVLAEVASRGRVNHILRGSYTKAGDIIRIDTMLQDAGTGEPISTERVEGTGEESIFSLVDDLTRKVKASFKFSEEQIADDLDKQVVEITTSSPEAYKYYIEAGKMGNLRNAIEFYEKAVAVDSGFASAYLELSISYWDIGMESEGKKCSQKAFELRDRVSDRERYRIEGDFYSYSEKTLDKAIEAFHKVLELYPEDIRGNQYLGWIYYAIEEWDKAIEILKVNIRNKDENASTYAYLSASYRAKGLYEKAIEVLELYLDNISDRASIHQKLAITYLCQGKYDIALNEANEALSLEDIFFVTASIYSCRGEFLKAEKEIQLYLDNADVALKIQGLRLIGDINLSQGKFKKAEEVNKHALKLASEIEEKFQQCYSHYYLAYTYLKSGELDRAIEEIEKAWILSVEGEDLNNMQRRSLFLKGLIYLEMGLLDKAHQTAEELKTVIDSGMNKKAIRLYHHLMGMLMLKNENFPKAIELFNQSLSFLHFQKGWGEGAGQLDDHAMFIEPLALSYYKSGNLEKAIEEYGRIISLTTGRFYYGDIYAKSFYMLGKIYEQKDFKGKAIEHYEKFLDLWKDADPGIAEVDDARERLAGLKD